MGPLLALVSGGQGTGCIHLYGICYPGGIEHFRGSGRTVVEIEGALEAVASDEGVDSEAKVVCGAAPLGGEDDRDLGVLIGIEGRRHHGDGGAIGDTVVHGAVGRLQGPLPVAFEDPVDLGVWLWDLRVDAALQGGVGDCVGGVELVVQEKCHLQRTRRVYRQLHRIFYCADAQQIEMADRRVQQHTPFPLSQSGPNVSRSNLDWVAAGPPAE